jgi:hypothetical protein
MENRQYVDTCRTHAVHDSIGRLNYFANLRMLEFGHDSPGLRKSRDLLRTAGQPVNDVKRIARRVFGDVIVYRNELTLGVIRPMDLQSVSP